MQISMRAAMRLLEKGDLAAAAEALDGLAGPEGRGVIARFRQAESLSRLGRHDEAVAAAEQAAKDAPDSAAAAIWLLQCRAEAGDLAGAAATPLPPTSVESLGFLSAGYGALARLASGDRARLVEDREAILGTHHHPLYSLTLRALEARRLAADVRSPDLISVWAALECRLEMEDEKRREHPTPPNAAKSAAVVRYLRLHWSCEDHAVLIAATRRGGETEGLDEAELETHLAFGRTDQAVALAERLAEEAGKKAPGELAIDRARARQLRGEPARPRDFDGFDDARKRLPQIVAWLDMNAALLEGDPVSVRRFADVVAEVAKREFVEAVLADR